MDTDQVLKIKILLKGLIYYNIYIFKFMQDIKSIICHQLSNLWSPK
jgi:hypothetical protein